MGFDNCDCLKLATLATPTWDTHFMREHRELSGHLIVGGNGDDSVGGLVQGDGRELPEGSFGLGDPSEL